MKRKRIDFLRLFGNSVEEERVMSVGDFYEYANTETEHPKLYIMAAVARALFWTRSGANCEGGEL